MMVALFRIFLLELKALVRSKTLAMLVVAAVGWMLLAPCVFLGDGTPEGARLMAVRYSLGGVECLLAVALLAAAAGSLSGERAAKRLQLTLVRPVSRFAVAFGRILALTLVGAFVLALAAGIEALRDDGTHPCRHVFRPVLPSPRAEAETMYEAFLADPETPPEVRKAKRSVVLRFLEQRAQDHYQTLPTNSVTRWRFHLPEGFASPSVRFRFTNTFDTRDTVRGPLTFGEWTGQVSNITRSVVTVPLARAGAAAGAPADELIFANEGKGTLMLRPRKDVELLTGADAFGWNLFRAWLEMVCLLAVLVSFGVFLGACMGRPAAIFVAGTVLLVSELAPSVIAQYPDQFEKSRADAIGLEITRAAAMVTHPVGALNPLERLAADECIERAEVARTAAVDLVLLPVLLAFLASLGLTRRRE